MAATGKTDQDFVQEAYGDAVKRQVDVYFGNCICDIPLPEDKGTKEKLPEEIRPEQAFMAGLNIIRAARDRARTLVGTTDQDFVQEVYGEAVKQQVQTYFLNCIDHAPANEENGPEQKFMAGLKIIREARDQAMDLVQK